MSSLLDDDLYSASQKGRLCLPPAHGRFAVQPRVLWLGLVAIASLSLISYLRDGAPWLIVWGLGAFAYTLVRLALLIYCRDNPGAGRLRNIMLAASITLQSAIYAAAPVLAILYGDSFERVVFVMLLAGYLLVALEIFNVQGVAYTAAAWRAGRLRAWHVVHWMLPLVATEAAAVWRRDIWYMVGPLIIAAAAPLLAKWLADTTRALVEAEAQASELHRRLAEMSRNDALTGLSNRRTFDRILDHEVAVARRAHADLSLLLIDADYFKRLNDRWGHQAGDDSLRGIARILEACLDPAQAVVARYGGEEFAIVLPGADAATAAAVADHVLACLRAAALPHPASPQGLLTVSIGVATAAGPKAMNATTLLTEADAALYRAKTRGRDQWAAATDMELAPDVMPGTRRPDLLRPVAPKDIATDRRPAPLSFFVEEVEPPRPHQPLLTPPQILLILLVGVICLALTSWSTYRTGWSLLWLAATAATIYLRLRQQYAFVQGRGATRRWTSPAGLAATSMLLSAELATGGVFAYLYEDVTTRATFWMLETAWAAFLIVYAGYAGPGQGSKSKHRHWVWWADIVAIALPLVVPAATAAWTGRIWEALAALVLPSGLVTAARLMTETSRRLGHARAEALAASTQLAALATTDGLTGVGNRAAFESHLRRESLRAGAAGGCVALLLIDIDHFKLLNDTRGHQTGDECLRWVADVLAGTCQRATDHVARYGGEEFAVLLPHTDPDAAVAIADRARQSVADLGIWHPASPFGRITISVGCAVAWGGFDPFDLTGRADAALYAAKRGGRNQVGLDELPAQAA